MLLHYYFYKKSFNLNIVTHIITLELHILQNYLQAKELGVTYFQFYFHLYITY